MQYSVKLQTFEGPLDLLLHLIQKNDLDLYDIPVKEITEQYMIYIHTMQVLQLDIASEYLVMASTLLHMKSQMLLPAQEDLEEEDFEYEEEDPREELMQRLIEYKRFKEAAGELKERERERSDLFSKPMTDLTNIIKDDSMGDEEKTSMNVSIYDMLQAFQKLTKRKEYKEPVYSRIQREDIPIDEKMSQILQDLHRNQGKRKFSELFDREDKNHIVVAFLALLELMKANAVFCYQDSNFDEIMVFQKGALSVEES
ncbi:MULTISPECIES: segregation/condensation protein A [Bacillaceae]|uniref:Segregation and condensation protein A n=1 Tax=Evansella alkalicola TaxID=745819 RepID=A0ABS6JZJ7_9BACI|nr:MULTISPECIES: segregation/condensation protein A [Bacillaceae]MBU9724016.1 segregation/condensation protein A [Bacillus alkalicola]